jgi:hypothetical protein
VSDADCSPHAPSRAISRNLARQIRTNSYGERLPPPLNESTLDLSDEIDETLVANGSNATDTALLLNLTNGTNTSSPPPPGMPPPPFLASPPPPSIDAPCFFGTCREFLYYREPALSSISPSGGPVRGWICRHGARPTIGWDAPQCLHCEVRPLMTPDGPLVAPYDDLLDDL